MRLSNGGLYFVLGFDLNILPTNEWNIDIDLRTELVFTFYNN